MELRSKDEDFGLGLKIGWTLGVIVGFVFAHLLPSATNSEGDKPTRSNCTCSVETEAAK